MAVPCRHALLVYRRDSSVKSIFPGLSAGVLSIYWSRIARRVPYVNSGLTRTAYTMPIFFGRGFFVGQRFGWQLISSGEKKSKVCIVVHRDIACTFLCTRFIWRCVLGCYMSVYSFSPPDCQKRACWLYIGLSDVTESMVTIRRHFVGITRHNALS